MSSHEFRDDDNGYMEWRVKHPDGYVINIHQSYSPIDAHLHDASCSTLITPIEGGLKLTNQYVKVCGETLAEMEDWAADHVSEAISPCGICRNVGAHGGYAGNDQRGAKLCSKCLSYELSVTGRCPSCDED